MIFIATSFQKLQTVKDLEHSLKNTVLEHPLTVNMLKGTKPL